MVNTKSKPFARRAPKTVHPHLAATIKALNTDMSVAFALEEARAILKQYFNSDAASLSIDAGQYDDTPLMDCTIAGLYRGQDLKQQL